MSESKVTEHFAHNAAATLESAKSQLKPLCTAGDGWEKDLRISPVIPTNYPGLTPKAATTENFSEKPIPALETQYKEAKGPAAALTPHYEIKNAETIEDEKNG